MEKPHATTRFTGGRYQAIVRRGEAVIWEGGKCRAEADAFRLALDELKLMKEGSHGSD